jgi:hypothetical protein
MRTPRQQPRIAERAHHLVQLLVLDLATAIRIERLEDLVDLLARHLEPERGLRRAGFEQTPCRAVAWSLDSVGGSKGRLQPARHDRLAEFLLIDLARAILVPLAEQIEHARRRAGECVPQRELDELVLLHLARAVAVHCCKAGSKLLDGVMAHLAVFDLRRGARWTSEPGWQARTASHDAPSVRTPQNRVCCRGRRRRHQTPSCPAWCRPRTLLRPPRGGPHRLPRPARPPFARTDGDRRSCSKPRMGA